MDKNKEFDLVLQAFGNLDAKVLARLRKPFKYEEIKDRDGVLIRYRISDDNDDAIASTYDEVYAKLIVDALNKQ